MEVVVKITRKPNYKQFQYELMGDVPPILLEAGYDTGADFGGYLTKETSDPGFGTMIVKITITSLNKSQGNRPDKWNVEIVETTPFEGEKPYVSDFKGTSMFDRSRMGESNYGGTSHRESLRSQD